MLALVMGAAEGVTAAPGGVTRVSTDARGRQGAALPDGFVLQEEWTVRAAANREAATHDLLTSHVRPG